jgi:hypothetical protein
MLKSTTLNEQLLVVCCVVMVRRTWWRGHRTRIGVINIPHVIEHRQRHSAFERFVS